MVHIVEAYKGGTYGFYSAHASNTFSVVVFLIILLGRKYPICLYAGHSLVTVYVVFQDLPRRSLPGRYCCRMDCRVDIIGFLFGEGALKLIEIAALRQSPKGRNNK
jgi:hypothetical protein